MKTNASDKPATSKELRMQRLVRLDHNFDLCPNCGGKLHGDGYTLVRACENADPESYEYHEPDAPPVLCVPNAVMSHGDEPLAASHG